MVICMDKYIGKRLDGRYEIKEIIGVGGMAYVYKAYDTIDDRVVAIKILKEMNPRRLPSSPIPTSSRCTMSALARACNIS